MRAIYYLVLLLLPTVTGYAQQNYTAAQIPKELTARASAVVRNMQVSIEVKDLQNVTFLLKKAVTVLNKNGDGEAEIELWYDKMRQVRSVRGTIFDEFGLPVLKFSEKNFSDESAVSDFSLFEDSRIKRFRPSVTSYPYTIEYEYEIRSKQTLLFPDWVPNPAPGIAVERAGFIFSAFPGFDLRTKENNYPGKTITGTSPQGFKTWSWEVNNLKALRDEPFSPDPELTRTSVQVAPEQFSYAGVTGSFTNWNEFGRWMYDKLLSGRNLVPPATAARITELTADNPDPKGKAKKIYEYLQQKTRYISVQVGIGGYQPITADEVDRLGYGDCKGLVNYMQGLLKVVGINSWYTVVEAGSFKRSASPGFATMNQGNHVILCIPFERDTTWLECTSQQMPFGFLGDFTDDRVVVACTPDGGKVMRTPVYAPVMNTQLRKAEFKIDVTGKLEGEMITRFAGTQYDNREALIRLPYTEQLKKLGEVYAIGNLEIKTFKLEEDKQATPVTTERISFTAEGYGVLNDQRLYVPLNEVNKLGSGIREVSNRVNPVYINRGYTDVDHLVFTLPEGYLPEDYPQNVQVEKPFGKFSITSELKGNQLLYTRTMQLNQGFFPAETYQELVKFYQQVVGADNRKLVLLKKAN